MLKFHVVESSGPILVGLPACEKLKLAKMHPKVHTVTSSNTTASLQVHLISTTEQLISEYPAQFKGIGKLPGKAHFDLDPSVTPVIHPPRKCPIHLKADLKEELDAMEQLEVIEPVTEATDWVLSLVVTKKPNGQLRVCQDPKDLNRAIKRPHHRMITTEEITHQLSGSTSLEKKMDEVLDGLAGVLNIAEDICVHGKDEVEHTIQYPCVSVPPNQCHRRVTSVAVQALSYCKTITMGSPGLGLPKVPWPSCHIMVAGVPVESGE